MMETIFDRAFISSARTVSAPFNLISHSVHLLADRIPPLFVDDLREVLGDFVQVLRSFKLRFSSPPSRRHHDLYIACCLSVLVFLVHPCRLSNVLIHKSGSRHFCSRLHYPLGHVRFPSSDSPTLGTFYTLNGAAAVALSGSSR